MEKQTLTNSSLTTFKTCPRRYQFHYEMGYIPIRESEPLYFGSLMHLGLAEWAMHRNLNLAIEKVEVEYEKHEEKDDYLLAKICALLKGYHEQYKEDKFQYLNVEERFEAPLLNPATAEESRIFKISGIKDGIGIDRGHEFIIEHKTTSEDISDPNAEYWQKLGMDTQISTYFLGAAVNGHKVEYCLYDVIHKPKLKPKQVGKEIDPQNPKRQETPQEFYERLCADITANPHLYYARKTVPRLEKDMIEFLDDTWIIAQTLRDYQRKKHFPRFTNSCRSHFGLCPYFRVCNGQASIEDPSIFKKVDNVHQEFTKHKEVA